MTSPNKPKPGRPPIDLPAKVRAILAHTADLPSTAERPLDHFEEHASSIEGLLKYVDDHLQTQSIYQAVYDRHMARLRRMAFVALVESFERFVNELAVVCVDRLVRHINDGRFDGFTATGGEIAAYFATKSIGQALCESETWLSNESINKRFRQLLKMPFQNDPWDEFLFPAMANQKPKGEEKRSQAMATLWQIRHTIVHNVGIITPSDSLKFVPWIGSRVPSGRVLEPTRDDFRYAKRFLVETAESLNRRVGNRLAEVLTAVHSTSPALFDASPEAEALSKSFRMPLVVAGKTGTP